MAYLRNAWYCAAWGYEVSRQPLARRILDVPVLLFRTEAGQPVAIGDRCPHRFAPLSKGEIIGDIVRCPYHGLEFDASGKCVANPHGNHSVPSRAKVPSFPVVEHQHAIWIWMGAPEAADISRIADLDLVDGHERHFVSGYIRMTVNHLLITDNLLDLTHAPYLHGTDIAPKTASREAQFAVGDDWVSSTYLTRAAPTPALQKLFFDEPVGDHHTRMRWTAPGALTQFLAMTNVNEPAEAGAVSTNVHLVTPETENSAHYFWGTARNRRTPDEDIDARLRQVVTKAFVQEDEPMIAACREYMGTNDLLSLHPIVLETDMAAIRARRILDRLIADEKNGPGSQLDISVDVGAAIAHQEIGQSQ